MNIFENATRKKFRFTTNKGPVSVEDLWDIQLTSTTGKINLDDIAKDLNRKLKENENISFVHQNTAADTTTQQMFDIVKYIIDVKIAEREALSAAKDRADKKQKILEILSAKQDESLKTMSVEDLQKMLEGL